MALTVGIDLGTTYSVIAYVDSVTKKPVVLKNSIGETTTPSVVGFRPDGSYVIGREAKVMEETGDVNTASFYKLHMGDRNFRARFYGREYTARDLSALFLKRLVEDAQKAAGMKIADAVITVPAYFEDAAKNDTLSAGRSAGLNVLNIINEPTAACVAYGLGDDGKNRKILIYDLGGGTFDVTIAAIKPDSIEVLATNGHHQLGGRDWDIAVADWMAQKFLEETGIDVSADNEVVSANMIKAENAKKQLSATTVAPLTVDNGEAKRTFRLSRREFEQLTSYQLGITTDIIDQTFEEIGIAWNDLDGAVLVGGSTRMPMVRNHMLSHGIHIIEGIHPDEAVAIGAAIQANISAYCALLPADKKKSSLSLPEAKKMDLTQLPGAKVIRDVISHSLGMIMISRDETRYVNDIMIRRNTPFDSARETKRRELRVSRKRERNLLDIYLLQGESENPAECTVAKHYAFSGIDYVQGGKSLLDITFLHTINGTIDISAVQTETGHPLKCREEPIPDDMSWVSRPPELTQVQTQDEPIEGALAMALDVSGSMSGDRIEKAKEAMLHFVGEFKNTGIKIAIAAFSDSTAYACHPTKNMDKVRKAIRALEVPRIGPGAPENARMSLGGGTSANPMPDLFRVLNEYASSDFKYAIVLTDGAWSSKAAALQSKQDFVRAEIEIIGMGFGEADERFLRQLSTRSDLAKVDDIRALNENLSTIAHIIM